MSGEAELQHEEKGGKTLAMQILFGLIACAVTCIAYVHFVVNTASVDVEIDVAEGGKFSIYWAAEGENYSERQVAKVVVTPEEGHYSFDITDISKVQRLRIDPHSYTGEATLKYLKISQEGYEPIILSAKDGFQQLVPLHQIEKTRVDDNGLWLQSSGEDPNFELMVSPNYTGVDRLWLFVRLLIITIVTLVSWYFLAPLLVEFKIVSVLLFGAWLVIIAMAGISKQNAHPDEYVHIAATAYYADHWLPPVVEDPAIRDTYSVYGVSRLNNGEIYYLCAGKIYKISQILGLPDLLGYRIFNLVLFGTIFLLSIRNVYTRIAAIPFLISPQIWYVFAYCTSDAFALFISFVLVCQLINPTSILHLYLKGQGGLRRLIALVVLPVIIGTLFLLKLNYLVFVGIFYLALATKIFFTEEYYWDKKAAVIRLILLTFLGLSFLGIRVAVDYSVNGLDRVEKIEVLKEELSAYDHRKSTPPEERTSTLFMKDRGVQIKHLLSKYYWDIQTFQSGFGVYGYLSIVGSKTYYNIVKAAGLLLLTYLLLACVARGGLMGAGVTISVFGASIALIGASLYHAWIIDFQPQGRYLFPIIPMCGIVLGQNIKALDQRMLLFFVGSMYVLGLYNFIFQGLYKIPKIPF